MIKKRWLFAAKVLDRPGVLTAVSAVLSNRGVSVQMTLGSTLHLPDPQSVPLFYVIEATDSRKNELLRAVSRLETVLSCECYPYDSPKLRAVAFARVDPRRLPQGSDVPALASEDAVAFSPIACSDESETWILMSSPHDVGQCLAHLKAAGALMDVSTTIIPVE